MSKLLLLKEQAMFSQLHRRNGLFRITRCLGVRGFRRKSLKFMLPHPLGLWSGACSCLSSALTTLVNSVRKGQEFFVHIWLMTYPLVISSVYIYSETANALCRTRSLGTLAGQPFTVSWPGSGCESWMNSMKLCGC